MIVCQVQTKSSIYSKVPLEGTHQDQEHVFCITVIPYKHTLNLFLVSKVCVTNLTVY